MNVEMLRERIAELEAENAELRKNNDLYTQIIENMPAGFLLYEPIADGETLDMRILQINAQNERMLGRKREKFLGQRYSESFPDGDLGWLGIVNEAASRGESVRFEYFSKVHQGRFDVIGYGVDGERGAILFIDAEDRKQVQDALRISEERLQTVLKNMPVMMTATDKEGRVRVWNRECERVTGYSAEEMVGRDDYAAFWYPDGDYRARVLAEGQARGGSYRDWEIEMTCKDGSRKIIAWSNVSAQFPVEHWDRWAVGVEVTPRVQAEQEIRRLNADLEARVRERMMEFEVVNQALQDQIVESIQAQELSQRYADEITDLYNNAPCGYHSLDANGMFIRMNDTELKLLGYSREDVIGRLGMVDVIPPEHAEFFRAGFENLKQTGSSLGVEGLFVLKDGSQIPILLNSTAAYDEHGTFLHSRSTVFDISERKQAEALAKQYAFELEELYNNAPFGYHTVDAKGMITRINDTELKWLGYNREEIVSKVRMFDLLTPESLAAAQQTTPQIRDQGKVENLELTVIRKDGSTIPMLFSGRAQIDADGKLESVRVTLIDITERKKTDALLVEYTNELADLYDHAPCGYYSLDREGVFIRINDTQLAMLGYSREEVVGKLTIFDLYPAEGLASARQRFDMMEDTGGVRDVETVILRKDGTTLPVLINSSVIYDRQGRFARTRSTMVDLSELRKAQNLIIELNRHLEERAAMLEEANKELESFSYSVSHDLRAPLRAIDGFSRVVMETYGMGLPEQGQHYLRRVRDNAGRMGQLIDDLLDFSRINRRPINKTQVSPEQIALQVVTEMGERDPNLKAEIVVDHLPECWADAALLRQVYDNLIGNAVKFTRKRENPRIEVGCQQLNGELIYFVKDNGVGFNMEYVDKIFGVFQRLHNQSEYEGTGVGLATVQRIIHRHGGRIWVEAVVDAGASFYFTME